MYNPWPIGHIPKELQRQEPYIIREMGYRWDDPRDIIYLFEEKVAKFAGSKYAVSCDCCTHAMELSLTYHYNLVMHRREVTIPVNTYISVPIMLKRLGFRVEFDAREWSGLYFLKRTLVIDGAVRWTKNMYVKGSFHCLSFQIKKRIPIGRGGMILTDDKDAYDWLKLASYDGRDLKTPYDSKDHLKFPGYHYYMTPEDAARGIILMDCTPEVNEDTAGSANYPNVKEMLKL